MFSKRCAVTLAVVTALGPCSFAWAAASNSFSAPAIEPAASARPANADVEYQALRGALPNGEGVKVKGLTLERQGGIFHFDEGSVYFYGPVNGRVTGAVFEGTGHFELAVKDASEQHSLARLTKGGVMEQTFSTLVLRFTDGTAEEIRKASVGSAGVATSQAGSAASALAGGFRKRLNENFDIRLLADVIASREGEFFMASFRMGGAFTGRNVLFVVDPMGTFDAAPDQVELSTWDEEGSQIWAAYRMVSKEGRAEPGDQWHVAAEKLDVTFEKSGMMRASAEATLAVKQAGVRVVPMNVYPTLRVSGVFDEAGQPLDFVQEDKDADPQFAVILKQPTTSGQTLRLLVKYAGKDAVRLDGDGVYYLMPGARESWYPSGNNGLGDFADFHMTFHLPKGLGIVATGKEISRDSEGGGTRVVWETQAPIPVAGFNLGEFKSQQLKTPLGFDISAYANVNVPDFAARYANDGLGSLSGVPMLPVELAQGSAAIQIYSDFFGKLPYDHVALTQQSACNYGQSWPMLVYLPTCAFWDSTQQHAFGLLDFGGASYWKEVTAHEVSHQWWGQMVGFKSYRDQWMSEGFANFSVSLYLMHTRKSMDDYRAFWKEQQENLMRKNVVGVRPIDVGPLTMGYRVANEKTGNVYQDLIYSKGAYVMHMLQMMYWTPKYGEEPFKHSMQAFVAEYAGKAATTEDLKASFEKTMPPWVNLTGDGKLDWFFNEYVYGTELPHEVLTSEFTANGDSTTLHVKLTQSNVSNDFVVLVPLYIQFANGNTVRLATVPLHGSSTFEKTVDLGKLPSAAKKLVMNYNYDVLTD
jgi:hypothetical protein